MRNDISRINTSKKPFIPADKTTNFYVMEKSLHDKLLLNSISSSYKKVSGNIIHTINQDAQQIVTEMNIHDRAEQIAERQAFVTLKNHKDNFLNKPSCRLINPAKSELGRISKQILDNINASIRQTTMLNQRKNSSSVIEWFTNIPNKQQHTFVIFDIVNFYPSITENLLQCALSFARNYCNITDKEINIIMHARKSLLFNNGTSWMKKDSLFDVTMGSFDGAEICELIGLYILDNLCGIYGKNTIGLYRDDGLAVFKHISGPESDRIRKDFIKRFKTYGLSITIEANLKVVNYLDVTFNLTNESYCPYRKPNDLPLYIDIKSNHPPSIIKHPPEAVNRQISSISCNETEFNKAKPIYEYALKSSGFTYNLSYNNENIHRKSGKNRQRNIIWYNPPYSKNVSTNIGRIFLKHFPKHHKFYSIFNKNNIKVSYSCMENMHAIISKHNKKILYPSSTISSSKTCNCRIKDHCPLDNNCLSSNIIYKAKITTDNDKTGKNYIGLTEGTFKQRFTQHKLSFNNRKYASSTELSKYIWRLKDNDEEYNIKQLSP